MEPVAEYNNNNSNNNNAVYSFMLTFKDYLLMKGYAVAQLVEALRYKPESPGLDSRWCHWNFSLT